MVALRRAYFGSGTGPIYLDDLLCSGTESSLLQCNRKVASIGINDCTHSEDAGVACGGQCCLCITPSSNVTPTCVAMCMDGALRLMVGSGTEYYLGTTHYDSSYYSKPGMDGLLQGRVELCMNGSFGQVCDKQWTNQDASVACRALGLSPYGQSIDLYHCPCLCAPAIPTFCMPFSTLILSCSALSCKDFSIIKSV